MNQPFTSISSSNLHCQLIIPFTITIFTPTRYLLFIIYFILYSRELLKAYCCGWNLNQTKHYELLLHSTIRTAVNPSNTHKSLTSYKMVP